MWKSLSEYARISLHFCIDDMDVEMAIQDDYLTSPVLYSIPQRNTQQTINSQGKSQRVHFQVSSDRHPLPERNNLEKK